MRGLPNLSRIGKAQTTDADVAEATSLTTLRTTCSEKWAIVPILTVNNPRRLQEVVTPPFLGISGPNILEGSDSEPYGLCRRIAPVAMIRSSRLFHPLLI